MLKVIYTETGQYLETTAEAVCVWMAVQKNLAHHVGRAFFTEPCRASLLVPRYGDLTTLLDRLCGDETSGVVEWAIADADFIEVTLVGYWTASTAAGQASANPHCIEEGVVVLDMDDCIAAQLLSLWNAAQVAPAFPSSKGR